jgi:hypothetical protein
VSTVIKSSARPKVVEIQRTGRYDLEGIEDWECVQIWPACHREAMAVCILPGKDEDTWVLVELDIRYPNDNRFAMCRTLLKPQAAASLTADL